MSNLRFVLSRLWRFHNLYFLKPNDAINDTLTASLLYRLDWSGPIVEIGSGDGVFSYIMHGGYFPISFDRYLQTDLSMKDIYDNHQANILKTSVRLNIPKIVLALDAKESHVKKIKEIAFAHDSSVAAYEDLPIIDASISKIFYYTPHGLNNHEAAISEAARVLAPGGKMLILLYDDRLKSSFLCYQLAQIFTGNFASYFSRLDNGRFDEITNLSKSPKQWDQFFLDHGFLIEKKYSGLSTFAWKVYDVQTRPVLKLLIKIFNSLPKNIRTIFKVLWMIFWYPYLVFFYILFSNEYLRIDKKNCYIAFQVKKII